MTLEEIEKIELKYLNKFYHFLKFAEDEMMIGFATKEKIKDDWYGLYSSGISDFAVGAERIVYSLLNGKGIGQPNSSPVGADLFFEVSDAFIHIDLKTVEADGNIGDYTKNIFVGSFAKTINWIDTNIIDKAVNNTKTSAQNIKRIFMKTHTLYTTDNSGAMLFGVVVLLVAILAGGVM